MYSDETIKIYSELTEKINRAYANETCCDFHIVKQPYFKNRHPAWERVPMIIDLLKKDYEYIIYIDADAFFRLNNDKTRLDKIIKKYKNKDIIFSQDLSQLFNTGFMIIKNTRFSRNFFWKLMINQDFKPKYKEKTWEQDCTIQLYNENYLGVKEKSIILDYGILQTYDEKDNLKSLIVHYEKKTTKQRFEKIISVYKDFNDLDLLRFADIFKVFYV
jgi:hypothetical protein